MIFSFLTDGKIVEYIWNMGNNLITYSIAVGYENICFLTPHFKIIKRDKINYVDFLRTNDISADPFD